MALPTGPIPRVAFDEIIEEDWGDSVAQSLNNLKQAYEHIIWTPDTQYVAPNSYSSTGDLAVWFRVGGSSAEVTVPDWATRAIVRVDLNGVGLVGGGSGSTDIVHGTYDVQVQIGSVAGRRIRQTIHQVGTIPLASDRDWWGVHWTDYLNVDPVAGDRAVRILAGWYRDPTVDQRWQIDGWSDIGVFITYTAAAINFYPGL
jgi:hypothetical protein